MLKKVFIGLAAVPVASALAMTACGTAGDSTAVTTVSSEQSTESTDSHKETLLGGWQVYEEIVAPKLTEDSKKAFENAMKEYTGMELEPAALLATQLVSGTNYLYLCKGQAVTQDPTAGWYMTVVYQDLQGNARITSVEEIDIANVKTTDKTQPSDIVGGWALISSSEGAALPEDKEKAFSKASENYKEVSLSPLALLATQVVAGSNNLIICRGTTTEAEPAEGLYAVTMYVDPSGNAEFTDVEQLDMLSYIR